MAKRKQRQRSRRRPADPMPLAFDAYAAAVAAGAVELQRLMSSRRPKVVLAALAAAVDLLQRLESHSETNRLARELASDMEQLRDAIQRQDQREEVLLQSNRELVQRLSRYESDDPPTSRPRFSIN